MATQEMPSRKCDRRAMETGRYTVPVLTEFDQQGLGEGGKEERRQEGWNWTGEGGRRVASTKGGE